MKKYTQLTEHKRYQIKALLDTGVTRKVIAKTVDITEGTLSREIKRNTGKRGYRPKQAHNKALIRRKSAAKNIKMTPSNIDWIESQLRLDLSPEQVSGLLELEKGIRISHERIYQHVWEDKRNGGELYKHLRHSNKKRRKKYGSQDKRGQIKNRACIEERPDIVEQKTRIGDWEIDTVIGKNHKGALVTIVDRYSKFTLIKKVDSKHAEVVAKATITLLKSYIDRTFTITADNGKEFAEHEDIAEKLQADVYFAHPYSSWERGLNENTNGLIRQYFVKGSSFEKITDEQVQHVMNRLNHRPRKGLKYKTPYNVFFNSTQPKAA